MLTGYPRPRHQLVLEAGRRGVRLNAGVGIIILSTALMYALPQELVRQGIDGSEYTRVETAAIRAQLELGRASQVASPKVPGGANKAHAPWRHDVFEYRSEA